MKKTSSSDKLEPSSEEARHPADEGASVEGAGQTSAEGQAVERNSESDSVETGPDYRPDPGQHDSDSGLSADDRANRRAGGTMIIGVWVLMLGLMTWFAHQWYERSRNPNRNLPTSLIDGQSEIELKANKNGHYVASGRINGQDVVFLLDTGATSVSVPVAVAERIGLKGEYPQQARTANGTITVHTTVLESVSLGGLKLDRVQGHINPGMQGEQVLLGMSFLRYFDLKTSNDRLTISVP